MSKGTGNVVHIVGTGTIGEPLIGLLTDMRGELGIDEVTFHKRTPLITDRSKIIDLVKRGARLATDKDTKPKFETLGMEASYETEEALDRASVVIDCTPKGVGIENKQKFYERYKHNTRGFIAQGSEMGFGKPYARGVNDEALGEKDQFLTVVSCNTHNLSVILNSLAFANGAKGADNLASGRFLCIRRAADVGQDEDMVAAPEVSKHKDERFGTHHAKDAWEVFKTLGYDLNLFSSQMKVPTQYMHTIYFTLKVKETVTREDIAGRFMENPYVATTHKDTVNSVFSFGRDHGHYGRILNQTVAVLPTLHVAKDGHEVTGFCFTPQDGNALMSSVAATAFFLHGKGSVDERMDAFRPYLFKEV